MSSLLISHLILTFSTFFLGLYIFTNYQKGYLFGNLGKFLAIINIGSALTGLLINPTLKSPFVWLAIITLLTIPNGMRLLSKGKGEFKRSMFFSWLGLCIAMIGAFYPDRRLGFMLWTKLDVSDQWANTFINFTILSFGLMAIAAAVLVYKNRILKENI